MLPNSNYTKWFKNNRNNSKTKDGKLVEIIDLLHVKDKKVLSSWAKHLRNHYISDDDLCEGCKNTGKSKYNYLNEIKFPDKTINPGPSVRSGDFGEILVADYLQYIQGYIVPRTRYELKESKNESPKGIDVLGFKFLKKNKHSSKDELITFEVKCALKRNNIKTLQNAINDSVKAFDFKKPEALAAMRLKLKHKGLDDEVKIVDRFQNKTDRPYKEISGAASVHSIHTWDKNIISNTDASKHPNSQISIIVIRGEKLMNLVNTLYERACNEA